MKKILIILFIILTNTVFSQNQLEKEFIKLVNEYRLSIGKPVLVYDSVVSQNCLKHNLYMASVATDSTIEIGHTNVENSKEVSSYSVEGYTLSEIVQFNTNASAKSFVDEFKKSSPHHKIMISKTSSFKSKKFLFIKYIETNDEMIMGVSILKTEKGYYITVEIGNKK